MNTKRLFHVQTVIIFDHSDVCRWPPACFPLFEVGLLSIAALCCQSAPWGSLALLRQAVVETLVCSKIYINCMLILDVVSNLGYTTQPRVGLLLVSL